MSKQINKFNVSNSTGLMYVARVDRLFDDCFGLLYHMVSTISTINKYHTKYTIYVMKVDFIKIGRRYISLYHTIKIYEKNKK